MIAHIGNGFRNLSSTSTSAVLYDIKWIMRNEISRPMRPLAAPRILLKNTMMIVLIKYLSFSFPGVMPCFNGIEYSKCVYALWLASIMTIELVFRHSGWEILNRLSEQVMIRCWLYLEQDSIRSQKRPSSISRISEYLWYYRQYCSKYVTLGSIAGR